MGLESRTILISGGGIAGLATALCLARAGFRAEVFEKAEGFETIGAGLQISPNALQVIEELGLGARVKAAATGPAAIRAFDAPTGREIVSIPLGAFAIERYRLPYLVVHRADLHQVLLTACNDNPDITLHMGTRLDDAAVHDNGATALGYENGKITEFHGRALICADGVWSPLRQSLFALKPAVFSGLVAWRALIAAEQLPGAEDMENTQIWMGRAAHGVRYPVRGGRHLNLVVVTPSLPGVPPAEKAWAQEAIAGELRKALDGWHGDFTNLLDHRTRWTRWPLFTSPMRGAWNRGSLALVGDAAHAMLPFAAQGAAMALEDAQSVAAWLARSLDGGIETSEALEGYARERSRRVRKVAALARANRRIYHLSPPFSHVRNLGMRLIGGPRLLARQDWIYRFRPGG